MGLTSPLEQLELQRRFESARIPAWTQECLFEREGFVERVMDTAVPAGVIQKWEQAVYDGLVVDSSDIVLRGRGLWLRGGRDVTVVAVMLLQRLLLMDHVKTGRFTTEAELLETEAPDGESNPRFRSVELLVLADVGEAYRAASGWADAMIMSLLARRMSAGLPTLVVSPKTPVSLGMDKYLLGDGFYEVVFKDGE